MWSGPRNISTAMMRAFENRRDTTVIDEPFYAFFLDRTQRPDPGCDECARSQPTDWRVAVEHLIGPIPDGAKIFYQKHHTQQLLPEIDRAWLKELTHVFLIRDPAEVVSSYAKKRPDVTLPASGSSSSRSSTTTSRRASVRPWSSTRATCSKTRGAC